MILEFRKLGWAVKFTQSIFQVVLKSSQRIDRISGQFEESASFIQLTIESPEVGDGDCL